MPPLMIRLRPPCHYFAAITPFDAAMPDCRYFITPDMTPDAVHTLSAMFYAEAIA